MNLKNVIENLVICIICILVGVGIGHKITKVTSESLVEIIKPTIEKAIDKETISNTITNAIDLKIDKIKKSDTLQINVNQEPFNEMKPTSTVNKNVDCAITEDQYNSLSDSQKKRIKRWIED
jgi:ABC-type dipeptide/oligopeptide/nickel transport system ATPase component